MGLEDEIFVRLALYKIHCWQQLGSGGWWRWWLLNEGKVCLEELGMMCLEELGRKNASHNHIRGSWI